MSGSAVGMADGAAELKLMAVRPRARVTMNRQARRATVLLRKGTGALLKVRKLQQKYGGRALVQWCHDESWFTLASQDPSLSVEELMEEFGLVPLRTYLARCEKALDDARERSGD